jgi:hypothetical protein
LTITVDSTWIEPFIGAGDESCADAVCDRHMSSRDVLHDHFHPDFGKVAEAMGLWGRSVAKAGELEGAIKAWLAQPGPALLDVKVNSMQLVMPPSPFVSPEAVVGMAVYTAKAMLHGKGHDVPTLRGTEMDAQRLAELPRGRPAAER